MTYHKELSSLTTYENHPRIFEPWITEPRRHLQKKKITKANEKVTLEYLSSKTKPCRYTHPVHILLHTSIHVQIFFISKAHWIPQRFLKSNDGELKSDLFNFFLYGVVGLSWHAPGRMDFEAYCSDREACIGVRSLG